MTDQDSPGFSIKDRRHFNVDGTAREGETIDESQSRASSSATGRSPIIGEEDVTSGQSGTRPPIFIEFISGLVISAQASMGMIDHPELRGKGPDFQSARQIIDLLGALRQKTEGNLSPEEERFFDEALAELRMNFVKRSSQQKS